ncbi:AAA family ATPase [Marinobacter metalliresistant]|uniref:ATP-binding protein n=1 Tax=Marinobacter metalliresistant TaxID=2961995 RepID=A0ABZ2VXW5_9GAMM
MLKKLKLTDFTVFSDSELSFAPGLNVVVGENGCGKSHLLKVAYSVIANSAEEGKKPTAGDPTKNTLQKTIADKLVHVMRPETLGRLAARAPGRKRCEVAFKFDDSQLDCTFSFATSSKSEVQINQLPGKWHEKSPVFIPTRELLTIFPNFVSVYENHYLEFEETYRDTCLLLGALALRGPREKQIAELLKPLEEAMGGKVVLDKNGRFYLQLPGKGNMEMPLVAEGLRKLAMIARLISTGSLLDKGYLFWDEPETNLNPKLVKLVAKVIYHLCQQGIQVFIATHSLFLLRELEVLSQEREFKKVKHRYFALKPETHGVEVEQGERIDDLNTLVLLDEELSQSDRFMEAGN